MCLQNTEGFLFMDYSEAIPVISIAEVGFILMTVIIMVRLCFIPFVSMHYIEFLKNAGYQLRLHQHFIGMDTEPTQRLSLRDVYPQMKELRTTLQNGIELSIW